MTLRLAVSSIVLAVMLVTPVRAGAEPHVLRYADGLDLTSLDPYTIDSSAEGNLVTLTGAYLTRGGSGHPIIELAAVVPTQANGGISADGKTITWHLRRGVRWSDGAAFTSADVAFSVRAIKKPSTLITDSSDFEPVERVDTPDAYTAVVHLSRPYGRLIDTFFSSLSVYPIVPEHLLRGVDFNKAPYQNLPVGIGPFRFVRFVRGERVELEANPYYFRGVPKLKRIIYRLVPNTQTVLNALRAGDIEFAPYASLREYRLVKSPEITAEVARGADPALTVLNVRSPAVRDLAVRRALRLALDRAAIAQRAFLGGGIVTDSLLPPFSPYFDPAIVTVTYDPKAAEAVLDAAGWKRGADGVRAKDGTRLHVALAGGAGPMYVDEELETIRMNWSAIGAEVESKRYTPSLFFAPAAEGGIVRGGKFDAVVLSAGTTTENDLNSSFECSRIPPDGDNLARICDPQLEGLLRQADRTYDPATRRRLYDRIQVMLYDLVPFVVLTARNDYYIHRTTVTGLRILPSVPFDDFMNVDVTQ